MFILIVGCSPAGYQLCKLLLVEGHEVVVLEKNLSRCQLMWEEMGSVVMQGDGADLVDLRRAGAARADTLVAVTGKDETNLVACQMAKHVFSIDRTVATIKDPRNQPIFRVLGVDSVINAGDLILGSLERAVAGSGFNHLANLREPNSVLVSLTIPEDAAVVGRTLKDIEPTEHTFFSVVVRANRALPPRDELVIEAADEIYAVTVSEREQELFEKLTGV